MELQVESEIHLDIDTRAISVPPLKDTGSYLFSSVLLNPDLSTFRCTSGAITHAHACQSARRRGERRIFSPSCGLSESAELSKAPWRVFVSSDRRVSHCNTDLSPQTATCSAQRSAVRHRRASNFIRDSPLVDISPWKSRSDVKVY